MTQWLSNASRGVGFYRRGFSLIARPGLKRFVAIPLLINTAVFIALVDSLRRQLDRVIEAVTDNSWVQWLAGFDALAWVVTAIQWLFWLLFGVGVVIAVFYAFALIANFIAAPFNGLLAEQVERSLRGRDPDTLAASWRSVLRSIPATLLSELRKLLYLALWMVPLLILTFIPGLNLLSSAAWLGFGAWLVALEYIDYPMGNHGHTFPNVRKTLRAHRATALGFGASAALVQSIPLVNLLAMPASVAGATALWVDQIDARDDHTQPLEQSV